MPYWKPSIIKVPELDIQMYEVMCKISQTHGMMCAFEKGKLDKKVNL